MDFVVSEENGCYTQEVLDRGGRIFFVPMRTADLKGAVKGIRKIVKENGYESVLKLSDMPVGVVDLIAAKWGGAKTLVLRSCNAVTGLGLKSKIIRAAFLPVLNMVANVKIAPSMLAAEFTFGKAAAHKSVHFLHNAVDLDVFRYDETYRQEIRKEFNLEDKLVVGHIGRFNKQKNHGFLLQVFQQIRAKNPNAVLLLIGKGELEEEIRKTAKELGVEDGVIFTGVRFDVPKLLSAMDVFVFPSLYEGMPNTVIEAQATGLPCVIADTITREANITGLVQYLPLENPEYWAQKALAAVAEQRTDTKQAFVTHKYDIESTAQTFAKMVFGEGK